MTTQEIVERLRAQKIKPYQKEIDHVLNHRSTGTRARAAIDLWLKVNPWIKLQDGTKMRARDINRAVIGQIQEDRELHLNKFAESSTGSMRHALEFPPGALEFIQLFHPDIFDGNPSEQKSKLHKLMRSFPEYSVPRVV